MVLLVEESPEETTLACAALALHCGVEVLAVRDVRAAMDMLKRHAGAQDPVRIAILGGGAVGGHAGGLVQALSARDSAVPVVGIADQLDEALRAGALGAGMRAVYERPREWHAYSALIRRVVSEWGAPRSST